ncbi:MerR family DNA-binding protein [Streptomyces sp. NPDC004980]
MTLQELQQILTVHDNGESPCTHVGRLLSDRLDHVRAQIAELVTLEAHFQTLLAHAAEGRPTMTTRRSAGSSKPTPAEYAEPR